MTPTPTLSPVSSSTGLTLPNSSKFPNLHAAFANVLNGVSDQKICVIGDSDSSGYPNNNGYGWAPQLVKLLKAYGIPASVGLAIPPNPNPPIGVDSRVALGVGWNNNGALGTTNSWGGLGASYEWTSTGTLVFTPNTGDSYDSYDVYYFGFTGGGTANVAAGAGTPTLINEGSVGNGVHKVTVSTTGAANLTCTITGVSGVGFIAGIEPFLSTTPRIRVGVASVNAASTSNWCATPSTAGLGSLSLIQLYAANAWIMELGGDDAIQGVPLATTFANYNTLKSNMIATAADIIGLTVTPLSGGLVSPTLVSTYMNNIKTWAIANNTTVIDTFTAWGGANAFNTSPTGSYYADILGHPSTLGLADIARLVFDGLVFA